VRQCRQYGVARAQGSRKYQEDEYTCLDNLTAGTGPAVFCVYDGHGTGNVSADASEHIHHAILASNLMEENIDSAIAEAFKEEDHHLYRFINTLRSDRAGSTATVAVVTRNQLHLGNVGDSRAVLAVLDDDGKKLSAIRLSKDHHPADPQETKRVQEAGGLICNGRVVGPNSAINMTRSLGDFAFKSPINNSEKDFLSSDAFVCRAFEMTDRVQFLVIASDGLWNSINDDHLVAVQVDECRKRKMTAEQTAKLFADSCAAKARSDNVTVIVVFFDWSGKLVKSESSGEPGETLISEHLGVSGSCKPSTPR